MAMMTWLADALRRDGLPVAELAGWQTRGHGSMGEVLGVLAHHTAGAASGNYPSQNIVVNGRSDLPGPLANLGLARDGTWIVIAAGQAWHAGTGSIAWCPANQGNSHLIGVEAESVGTRDDWTAAQRTSYPRGVAALLRHLNLPTTRAIGHKEWAPSRKIDPAYWDMNQFRTAVSSWLTGTATKDWFDMATEADLRRIVEEALTAQRPRQGQGMTGTTSIAAVAQWSDYAWTLDRGLGVQVRDELSTFLKNAGTNTVAGPATLTDTDVQRIAEAVAKLLGQRISAPGA